MLTNVDFHDSAVVPYSCTDHHLILSQLFQNYCKLNVDLLSDILSDDISWKDVAILFSRC